jgi:hypothetical protein
MLPCYTLGQQRNKIFFGREDVLQRIDEVLSPPSQRQRTVDGQEPNFGGETTPRTFVIYGIGGMGKTEIAVEYIHDRKTMYDAIFWVNSASTQKLNAGFRDIAIKLGLQDEDLHEDPVATREIVKGWLSNPVRTLGSESTEDDLDVKWLIVFDNADTPELLHDFWPSDGTGSILITSRNPLSKEGVFTEFSSLDLPSMPNDGASVLLQKLSLRHAEPDSLETCATISGRLGGLPLAIVQMAYSIRHKHLSLKEFVEYYEHDAKTFQESTVPGLTKYQTIASTWNIEGLSPSALATLQVISVLDPDFIPEDVLVTGAVDVDLENYPKTKIAYFEAREELIRSSLVSRNIELRFLKVHRLVQDVVRRKLSIDGLRAVYNTGVSLVTAIWPFVHGTSNFTDNQRFRRVGIYLGQVAAFSSLLQELTAKVLKPHIQVSALFNEVSW